MEAGLPLHDIERNLTRPIAPVRTSLLYQAGLILVAFVLVLLQATYVAIVVMAAYGTWRYLVVMPGVLVALGTNQFTLIIAIAPLVAGAVVTFFLLKPFLARPARSPDAFRVERSEQPVLFAFVDRLCDCIGSPRPSAIELDLRVNASARLNGWLSLFRSDLKLTIGIPVAAGLTLPQFSGILAHEFGHFSQHAGMRLYFLIEHVRHWFNRVAHERDKWDDWLDHTRTEHGWRVKAILNLAYGCVYLSRRILQGLLICGTVVSAWFSRQMEFNADLHEAELVGEQTFADTLGRLSILGAEVQEIWGTLDRTHKARRLCDDFAVVLRSRDKMLSPETRTSLLEQTFQGETGRWATHPSHRERLHKVQGIEGVIPASNQLPAEAIFSGFDQLCRSVTRHYYEVTLGISLQSVTLVPAAEFAQEIGLSETRAQALRDFFAGLQQPGRYFRLSTPGPVPASVEIRICLSDHSAGYWRVLDESLLRNAGLEFMRSGGRVNPASFRLSSGEIDAVAAEAADSRQRLEAEIARLQDLCSGQAQLLGKQESPFVDAYRALSKEQEALLDLRFQFMAFNVLRANLNHLSAARAANACENRLRRLSERCQAILANLANCASPLTPGRNLAEELLLFERADAIEPEELATRLLNRSDVIAAELLGELCAMANRHSAAAAG